MKFPNQVQRFRIEGGLSREDLATAAGVTRQTIGLIEAGRVCPSTVVGLRLARALGMHVEDVFTDPDSLSKVILMPGSEVDSRTDMTRVYVTKREGQQFARPVGVYNASRAAHAVWSAEAGRTPSALVPVEDSAASGTVNINISVPMHGRVKWLTTPDVALKSVFVSGCDAALGLLVNRTEQTSRAVGGVWFEVSNQQAMWELENGWTHIAAIHSARRRPFENSADDTEGPKQQTSESPPIDARSARYITVEFVTSEMGWMVQRGNPLGFRGTEELHSGRMRFVNRPIGSGARQQVDQLLSEFGIHPSQVMGYGIELGGHLAVAEAVRQGFADVGFGHAAAAAQLGLCFLPVHEEVCSLVIPQDELRHEGVQAILETVSSDKFLQELMAFGPYQVKRTGRYI